MERLYEYEYEYSFLLYLLFLARPRWKRNAEPFFFCEGNSGDLRSRKEEGGEERDKVWFFLSLMPIIIMIYPRSWMVDRRHHRLDYAVSFFFLSSFNHFVLLLSLVHEPFFLLFLREYVLSTIVRYFAT